jgi:hypothetical protein
MGQSALVLHDRNSRSNKEKTPMKVILLAGAIVASTAFGAYAAGTQLSQAECDTLWNKANPSGAKSITQAQA